MMSILQHQLIHKVSTSFKKFLDKGPEYKKLTSGLDNLGKKSSGGEIVVEKGGDYIKDLL